MQIAFLSIGIKCPCWKCDSEVQLASLAMWVQSNFQSWRCSSPMERQPCTDSSIEVMKNCVGCGWIWSAGCCIILIQRMLSWSDQLYVFMCTSSGQIYYIRLASSWSLDHNYVYWSSAFTVVQDQKVNRVQAVILNSCVLANLNLVLPFMIWWDCGLLPNLASMMKQKWLPGSSTLEIVRFRYLLVPTLPCTCNNSCTARISFKRRVIRLNLNLLACCCMWHTDINRSDLKLIKVSI
jgi:hypothetical protein